MRGHSAKCQGLLSSLVSIPGEFVCNWACGKSLDEADKLTTVDVIAGVGQPPLGREHCPRLAVNALLKALASD
jgi:NifU-like protein involved in Fe-S cluster formation